MSIGEKFMLLCAGVPDGSALFRTSTGLIIAGALLVVSAILFALKVSQWREKEEHGRITRVAPAGVLLTIVTGCILIAFGVAFTMAQRLDC
ncbi:MAG TPA: hypothetical protein VL325_10040 [Pyrinomonadaceae bacterium]|nr:hypothetical protein [Pyrinomonadaceae bacterium]